MSSIAFLEASTPVSVCNLPCMDAPPLLLQKHIEDASVLPHVNDVYALAMTSNPFFLSCANCFVHASEIQV